LLPFLSGRFSLELLVSLFRSEDAHDDATEYPAARRTVFVTKSRRLKDCGVGLRHGMPWEASWELAAD
jgi:hypothetical protein